MGATRARSITQTALMAANRLISTVMAARSNAVEIESLYLGQRAVHIEMLLKHQFF